MKFNLNEYIQAFLLTIIYYFILNGLTYLLLKLINIDFFDTVTKIYLVDLIPVFFTLSIIYFIFQKNFFKNKVKETTSLNILFLLILIILIRIFNDPIYRFFEIFNLKKIPEKIPESTFELSTQIFFVLKIVLFVPIMEELFFRGVILKHLLKKNNRLGINILFASALFALIHFNPFSINYITITSAFTLGVFLSLIYLNFGLKYSILSHIIYNFIWLLIKENKRQYFSILKELDFGLIYWCIILFSIITIIFVFKFSNKRKKVI